MNLFFECNMGAAGDMIASALVDLFSDKEAVVDNLNTLGLPDTQIVYGTKTQCGIEGTHLEIIIGGEVETPHHHYHHHHHEHRNLAEVLEIVDSLNVSDKVKDDVKNIYSIVAQAEAKAHNASPGEVHFHELGMLDAIADITISAYLLNELKPERILCSSINAGGGTVECAHGVLPVPAPATANILCGVPYYKSDIETELCTPTGAAVLKYFADEFTDIPEFKNVQKTGVGAGTKELERANIIRVFQYDDSVIAELSCNIDDMTGEEAAFAAERIMESGALDCFIQPIIMKKGRPAYMLTVLCNTADSEKFARLIFKHTTTIGIRKYTPGRYTLDRQISDAGGVHIKRSEGYGQSKSKPEFEDIKKLAVEKDISIFEARELIQK